MRNPLFPFDPLLRHDPLCAEILLLMFLISPDLHNNSMISFQVFAAAAVSTGCLSFGICMAYTSSAIPSMMEPTSAIKISNSEASWMSEFVFSDTECLHLFSKTALARQSLSYFIKQNVPLDVQDAIQT